MPPPDSSPTARPPISELLWTFARLGWLAFGGPVGQLGLMHQECVERRRWIDEDEFLRALNFCHALPGPEATQMAIYLGWRSGGVLGGVLAGLLFILPGYLTLTALGWLYARLGHSPQVLAVLWGFRPVGLALLLSALVRISRAALKTRLQVSLAALAFVAFAVGHVGFVFVLLGAGALFSLAERVRSPRALALPIALTAWSLSSSAHADTVLTRVRDIGAFFFKVGLFSFGGAYAALALLREGAVQHYAWVTDAQMVDALALGETTPGPLISIGIFLGYLAGHGVGQGVLGATVAGIALFLPSFVFVLAGAPFMDALTRPPAVRQFLQGVTCGVVGLMVSVSLVLAKVAVMPGGRFDPWTLALGVGAFLLVSRWKHRLAVLWVVLGGGGLGLARAFLPGAFG